MLVHEYVHAVVDELAQFNHDRVPRWLNEGLAEYVAWRYEGRDEPAWTIKVQLRAAARAHQLPSLAVMATMPPIAVGNPAVSYAFCASAARALIGKGGAQGVLDLIRDLGRGQPFDAAFTGRYGLPLARLQEEVQEEVNRP